MTFRAAGMTILLCLSYGAGMPSKHFILSRAAFPLCCLWGNIPSNYNYIPLKLSKIYFFWYHTIWTESCIPLTVLQKILLGALIWYGPRLGLVFIRFLRNSRYFTVTKISPFTACKNNHKSKHLIQLLSWTHAHTVEQIYTGCLRDSCQSILFHTM